MRLRFDRVSTSYRLRAKRGANAVAESSYRVLYEQLPHAKRGAIAVAESVLHEQLPRLVGAVIRVARHYRLPLLAVMRFCQG